MSCQASVATVRSMHPLLPAGIGKPSPRFPRTTTGIVLAFSLGCTTTIPRLQAAETLLLPETVVTASRTDEDSLHSMSSIGVITTEQFQEQGYRTIPEALANTPGVMVQKTTHGHG
ncbi:MAG: hypothetical protein VX633_12720, partial [Verrucomicrobiota bacterium]|nr:hypothetical protein [Verrucomicrobiota bacterium]